jgi:hypothetical protein
MRDRQLVAYRHVMWVRPGLSGRALGSTVCRSMLDFIRALCHKCPLVFGGTCIGAGPWEHVQGPAPMSFSMTALVL